MSQQDEMLRVIGVSSMDDLFSDIPAGIRVEKIDLPPGMDEMRVRRHVEGLARMNRPPAVSFAGAGLYEHYIPAAVRDVVMRSEFITSYTPYQPEVSQGILQGLFEYQSLIAEVARCDVVNSSMYDMGSALGEAALMSYRIKEGRTFLVPEHIHRWKRLTLQAYCQGPGITLRGYKMDPESGLISIESLRETLNDDVCGVYVESPNIFGCVEQRFDEIREAVKGIPLVAGVDPILLSITRSPMEYGADIIIAEGGSISFGLNFGGPLLGIFGTTKEHLRKMPGRIVGQTIDAEGRRAYCLTLATREQHIRRAKATSNICTNEAVCALASAVYLSLLGRDGLRKAAMRCYENAHTLARGIARIPGFRAPVFTSDFYQEFTLRAPISADDLLVRMREKGILAGVKLSDHAAGFDGNHLLVASTDVHTEQEVEAYIHHLSHVAGGIR